MPTENHAIGLHLSKWQGNVDMQAVKDQGFDFVYSRMGIGWGYIDASYAVNMAKARAVALPFGGYFVPSFPGYDIDPSNHINNLENAFESANGAPDFLVNDVEKFKDGSQSRGNIRDTIYQVSLRMLDYMGGNSDRVWQYTRANIWDPRVGDGVLARDPGPHHNIASDYPLHIAHYSSRVLTPWRQVVRPGFMPDIPKAWIDVPGRTRGNYTGWLVWQVYDRATGVDGTESNADAIELMKLPFFERLFGAAPLPPADPVDPTPPPAEPVSGTFTFQGTGSMMA